MHHEGDALSSACPPCQHTLDTSPLFLDTSPLFLDTSPLFLDTSPLFLDTSPLFVVSRVSPAACP